MSRVADVILADGGCVALPLFLWCLVAAAVFCLTCAGVVRRCRLRTPRGTRFAFAFWLLLVWMIHSCVLVYTCSQVYRIGWATNWHPASVPSADMIFNMTVICLMLVLTAGVLLLCASLIAVWDLQQCPLSPDAVKKSGVEKRGL